jgi:hypothetical protein
MAAEDYHDMDQLNDPEYYAQFDDGPMPSLEGTSTSGPTRR